MASETREGAVFQRLFEKLELEKEALGGKVFDILGKVSFNNRPLRELLIEAVRHGSDPAVQARLNRDMDIAFDPQALLQLVKERALTEDVMDIRTVSVIREKMERMEARRLQPYFIEAFFKEAFRELGGRMSAREKGRWEILSVPFAIRNRDRQIGHIEPVLNRYERICFDKAYRNLPGSVPAALICPGHPLLEAMLDVIRERSVDLLKRGAVLIDDSEPGEAMRLLFYIEHAIQDGTALPDGGRRVISRNIHFVEMDEYGTAASAGYAPYLDYRPAAPEELDAVLAHARKQSWLTCGVEDAAIGYALGRLIPGHLKDVRERRESMIDKTEKAVRERLTSEIRYWDYRAGELKEQEQAGKISNNLNSQKAERRAEELAARLKQRTDELAAERLISAQPPVVIGGALVIPAGLLAKLTGRPLPDACSGSCADAPARKAVELAAMQAVMDTEKSLGFAPRDVSADKCGYDIESAVPDALGKGEPSLRFIEVKGRAAGATNVIVTKNEILTALNQPEQFILALVEVDGQRTRTTYLKRPFMNSPDFSSEGSIFNLSALIEGAEIIYEG